MEGSSEGTIYSIRFSPDGRFALSVGDRLILWSVDTGRICRIFEGYENNSPVVNAIITMDGRFVLSGGRNRILKIWSMETGERIHSVPLEDFSDIVSFGSDGRFAATGRTYFGDSVKVWDVKEGGCDFTIPALKPKGGEGISLSMSPDGKKVAVGFCGRIELWDIETEGRILAIRPKPTIPLALLDTIWKYLKI